MGFGICIRSGVILVGSIYYSIYLVYTVVYTIEHLDELVDVIFGGKS